MTQGKIERYRRSMKNLILLDHYYSPSKLEDQIRIFVDYYNHDRYHEALKNVTPAGMYYGRDLEVLELRWQIKQKTMLLRRKQNLLSDLLKRQERFIWVLKPSLSF